MNKSKVIVAMVGVVIVAGSIFLYQQNTSFAYNIFDNIAKKVSASNFIQEKVDGTVTIKDDKFIKEMNLSGNTYPKVNFSLNEIVSKNGLANTVPTDVKVSGDFNLSTENFPASVSADSDFVFLNDTSSNSSLFFIRLKELKGIPLNLSSIVGKWWKIDLQALIKQFGGPDAGNSLAYIQNSQLAKERIDQLKTIFLKYKSAIRVQKLADGSIGSAPAYHLSLTLDKVKLSQMIIEIITSSQKDSSNKQVISTADIEKMLNLVDIKNIDLLVQKDNYLPVQWKVSMGILDETGKNTADLDFSGSISETQPIEIKAPDNSVDIKNLLGSFMPASTKKLTP
jgi:hypothetical protein